MRKHFVTFYSPGTFVSEETTKPIDSWDTKEAVRLSKDIVERYSARPFGFRFSTMLTADPVPDGEGGKLEVQLKEVARSGLCYLGGRLLTLEDVEARSDKKDSILLDNMRCNGWFVVIENTNSWRATLPFEEGDLVVDGDGNITERGDDPRRVAYRATRAAVCG